jgi:Trk-type K+ transport system membrane component
MSSIVGFKRNRKLERRALRNMQAEAGRPTIGVQASACMSSNNSAISSFCAWAFTVLILVGYISLHIKGTLASGNPMSNDRALFTAINATTLTGFQYSLGMEQYNPPAQWLILLLTIGGTQFALIAGGCAVTRIAKLPYTDAQVAIASLGAQLVVILLGTVALAQADQPLVATLLQSTSAFGNSGVWMGDPPELLALRTHLVFLPLAILGALGVPVLMDLFDAARRKRPLSIHTLTVLKLSAIVYVVAIAVLFVARFPSTWAEARTALASSSEAAINTRSAGLPIEFAADFPRSVQWALIALMMIGAAPGSAGSGLKVTTIGRLCSGVRDLVADRAPGRIFGIAIVWLLGFLAISFGCFLVLLATEPGLEADRLFFIAVSAASNCGLAHDRIGIVGTGLHALSITMLLGRVLPIAVLWWVVRHADQTDVAIG